LFPAVASLDLHVDLGWNAEIQNLICVSDMTDDPKPLLAEAEARLTKALAAVPNNAYAHLFMAFVEAIMRSTRRERWA